MITTLAKLIEDIGKNVRTMPQIKIDGELIGGYNQLVEHFAIKVKLILREKLRVNDKDNIILFPTNRIKNKQTVKHPVDEKGHQKLVEQQTKEFVEGNVDDIAYQLLDKFVNMGIRTNQLTFTQTWHL